MKINLNDDIYIIPDSWDGLSKSQFIRIADLSLQSLPVNQFKLYILLAILNFKVGKRMFAKSDTSNNKEMCYVLRSIDNPNKIYLVAVSDLAVIINNSLAWLFKESNVNNKISLVLNCTLRKSLVSDIYVKGERWYGPADSLNNSIYEEYIRCLVSASEYSRGDSTGLDRLICAMYRPGNSVNATDNGDFRNPYNDNLVFHRAKFVEDLNPGIKIAILLQFNGAVANIAAIFPNAFNKGNDNNEVVNNSNDVFMRQLEIIDNLAQHRIPEKEQIRQSQLYDVLQTLDNVVKQNKIIKSKFKHK